MWEEHYGVQHITAWKIRSGLHNPHFHYIFGRIQQAAWAYKTEILDQ